MCALQCGRTLGQRHLCHLAITLHTTVTRKKADSSLVNLDPISIADYNKYMGGVDKGDQFRQCYQS